MRGQCSGFAFLSTKSPFNFIRTVFNHEQLRLLYLPTNRSVNPDPVTTLDVDPGSIRFPPWPLGTLHVSKMTTPPPPISPAAQAVNLEIAKMHSKGITTLRANWLAVRLWPWRRRQNANGQVFHLGAAVAARLLRNCPAVWEKEPRLWEILPHRLPAPHGRGV